MTTYDCCADDVIDTNRPGQTIRQWIHAFVQQIRDERQKRRTGGILSALNDHQLMDIGVTRASVDENYGSEFSRDLGHNYHRQTMIQMR